MRFPQADELANIALDKCVEAKDYHLDRILPLLCKAANNGRFGEIYSVNRIRVANTLKESLHSFGYSVTVVERVDNLNDVWYDIYIDWSHKEM